jgi:ankyrin repeat domain-containing protein 50
MRVPQRFPQTCEWILKHANYDNWLNNRASPILLVTGDPGCGKSVLASFLLDHLSQSSEKSGLKPMVCFFFFRDDDPEQRSAIHALCAILHQLFTAVRALVDDALVDWRSKGQKMTEDFASLWTILAQAKYHSSNTDVICILDGLDECLDPDRSQLLMALESFSRTTPRSRPAHGRLKFVVFSRPYQMIVSKLAAMSCIRLRAEDESESTAKDVNSYIQTRVDKFHAEGTISTALKSYLIEQLMKRADRTFLWVSLILDSIESSDRMIRRVLAELLDTNPVDLDAMYEKILNRSKNQRSTRRMLSIVVAAIRPLSLEEINFAFNIEEENEDIDEVDLELHVERMVRSVSALFVRIIDSKVFLVHQTGRKFLLTLGKEEGHGQGWKHSLGLSSCHLLMTRICMRYINLSFLEYQILDTAIDERYGPSAIKDVEKYCEKHGFIDYAASYWATHYREAGDRSEEAWSLSMHICNERSNRFKMWSLIYWNSIGQLNQSSNVRWTHLIARSVFNHGQAVMQLLHQGADINEEAYAGKTGGSALHWAARFGSDEAAQILLEVGKADIDRQNQEGQTSLHQATFYAQSRSMVQLLVERGANLTISDNYGMSPLHLASRLGNLDLVDVLLHTNTKTINWEVSPEDNRHHTPLYYAAAGGHQSVVDLLISHGADNNESAELFGVPGIVKWFNPEKFFGFIQREGGKDVFVHSSDIASEGYELLNGEKVKFDIRIGLNGRVHAVNVRASRVRNYRGQTSPLASR